ncbi:MAG: formylglycine-generating enzyme family protein [Myxococcales bacterium]|nr:formylglycine-generating enzyme family protein [Myxococcales bacterium]
MINVMLSTRMLWVCSIVVAGLVQGLPLTIYASDNHGMVHIPNGSFLMGCQPQDPACEKDEHPAHFVYLDAFYIDATEVTVQAYSRCVLSGKCLPPGNDEHCNYLKQGKNDHPVNCVNWYQAQNYCTTQGKRLPSEAEWERAARAIDGDIYPWGNASPASHHARFDYHSNKGTSPVGSYSRGAYGLYDMAGNVWEWVADCYDPSIYTSSVNRNPLHQPDYCPTGARVLRGGSFRNTVWAMRSSDRFWSLRKTGGPNDGFRCAASQPET